MSALSGQRQYISIVYDLLTDTLGDTSDAPCDRKMDFQYDNCLSFALARELHNEFGCVVPFDREMEGIEVCRFDNTTMEGREFEAKVINRYSYLSSSGKHLQKTN